MIATDGILTVSNPAPRTVKHREPVRATCPACGHAQDTRATTVKCGECRMVAPLSAFSGPVASRTYGEPRAFTIRGMID